jgi:hypothetical protein
MKTFLAAFCVIFFGGLAFANEQTATNNTGTNLVADPIDRLVASLSSDGMWQNGLFKPVDLPPSATPAEVLFQVDKLTGLYQGGKLTSYQIIEVRQVQIGSNQTGGKFTAVLLDTNLGKKIVLLQNQGSKTGWWSRVYD